VIFHVFTYSSPDYKGLVAKTRRSRIRNEQTPPHIYWRNVY